MADKIRVLYVDDETHLGDIAKHYLEKTGDFCVDTLPSAIEALIRLDTERYDAIVSDYQMPEMDGIAFLKQLKASGNPTPFIIFTGRGREVVVIEALNEGADFYLQKGGDPKAQFAELSNKIHYAVSKKQSEAALRKSEERYRSIVNDQTEMISRFTPDGVITFVNEAYRSYFTTLLDIREIVGHNIREVLPVKNYAGVEKFLHSLSRQNPIREIEPVFTAKDGSRHWQTWTVRALFDPDDNPAEYQVVGRDITDITRQKNTERELRRGEQRSLAVSLNAGSWIWEVDPGGVFRYSSPAVEEILGFRPDELTGKMHFSDLFDPSVREEQKAAMLAAFSQRESFRDFVIRSRHRSGTPVVLKTSGTPVFEDDGSFSGYYGIHENITKRKRAEEALAESEENYYNLSTMMRLVCDNVPDMIWAKDLKKQYLFTNLAICHGLLNAVDTNEPIGKNDMFFAERERTRHADDPTWHTFGEICRDTDQITIDAGKSQQFDEYGNVQGKYLFLDVHKAPFIDEHGKMIGTVGSARDITERKRAEEALRESRQILEAIINTIPVRVFWKDLDLTYLGCNTQFARDAGFEKPEEIIGKDDYAMGWGKQAELYRADDRLVIESGKPRLLIEEPQTTPSGNQITLLTSKVPLKDAAGEIIGVLGTYLDITERKRAEEALHESEERYRQLVENLNDVVFAIDHSGTITYLSPVAERKYGYSSNDLLGKPFTEVIFKDDIPYLQKRFAEISAGIIVPFEWRLKQKDGSLIWVRSSTRPVLSAHGTGGFLGIVSDISREKEAEQALRQSESRARAMIQAIPDRVFRLDREGIFLDYKADISDLYDQSGPTLIGQRNRDVTPPEFADLVERQIRTVLESGIAQTFEYELPIPGRGVRKYEARMVASGPDEVTTIVRDITDRKRAEEALAESESFNRGLVENLPEYLSVYGPDGILLYVNPASAKALGFEAEEMVGRHVLSFIPGEYHELVTARMAARQKGGDTSPYEIEIVTKDGLRRSMIVKATPILFRNNPAMLLLLIDITERKQAEEALHEAARYTRSLIEASLDSLVTISPEGRITDVNAATERVTGFSRDHLIGTDFSDYFTDLERAKEGYRNVFDQGVVLDYPLEIRHRDGKTISVLYNATLYRDAAGTVQGVFAAARDITKRKRVEDALQMANRKLNILSSITRHDINNQLAVLVGYLRILEKKQADPTLNIYSDKVATAAERIAAMIRFTKEYELVGVKAPAWQDCRALADAVTKDVVLGPVVVKNTLTANTEVFADPLIVKVFFNLMDNAVRYGGKITTIRLSFEEREGDRIIVCEDDGDGVPAADKEKIFDWGVGKNTGLGLALSREILDITGITLHETGKPGKGARFEMAVPKGMWRTSDSRNGRP